MSKTKSKKRRDGVVKVKKTKWIFGYITNGYAPTLVKFTTRKTDEELIERFGEHHEAAGQPLGKLLLSMYYIDNYAQALAPNTLLEEACGRRAMCGICPTNSRDLEVFNMKKVKVVDLDKVFSEPVREGCQFYPNVFEMWNG